MMIDYVSLMLINMAAGLFVLALFILIDINKENNQYWAPAFAITGLIASICGFAMIFSWPIPAPYDIAYGEPSVLLGFLFLGAAWSLAKGWPLFPLGIYAFLAGIVGVVIGARFIYLGLAKPPIIPGIGFILTGSGGIFAEMIILNRRKIYLRVIGFIVLLGAVAIWAALAYLEYWIHIQPPAKA